MNSLPGGPESKSALRHSGSDSSTSGIALQVLNSAGVAKTKPQTQSVHSNGSTSETGSFATADNIASDSGAGAQSRVANSDTRVSIDEHAQPTPGTSILTCPSSLHSGRQERQSWWQRLRGVLNRVRLMTRIKLLILTPLAYAQIIVGIVILGLSTHETTDQPLRAFMILHIVRLFLYYPLYISHKLWPHRVEARGAGFKSWHKWLRNLFNVCAVVLFIAGNHWVFNSKSNHSTAPMLHYTSLSYIILGYIYLCLPFLVALFLLIVFTLFYTFSSQFRMRIHSKKGADLGQISQIPLVRYASVRLPTHVTSFSSPPSLHGDCHSTHRRSMSPADGDVAIDVANTPDTHALGSCAEASLSTASMHNNPGQRRHGLSQIHIINPFARIAHRLTRSKRQRAAEAEEYKSQLAGPVPDFTPRDPEDCMCAICLCDYEDGDILRLLPCHHHMHQGCVDEWLRINQKCPLCKQAVVAGSPKTQDTASSETSATPDHSGTAVASGESEIPAIPAAVH